MFAVLLPCIPCLTKHPKQDMAGNDRKKRKFDNNPSHAGTEPLKADDLQGLAGIRTRMQEMGHFLNDTYTDSATSTHPEIHLDTKTTGITAELISVVPREPRSCGGKPDTDSSILDRRPNPNRIPDRIFVACKANEEPSFCVEWDQFKKNIERKSVSLRIVASVLCVMLTILICLLFPYFLSKAVCDLPFLYLFSDKCR
jgi:hypothetical protein